MAGTNDGKMANTLGLGVLLLGTWIWSSRELRRSRLATLPLVGLLVHWSMGTWLPWLTKLGQPQRSIKREGKKCEKNKGGEPRDQRGAQKKMQGNKSNTELPGPLSPLCLGEAAFTQGQGQHREILVHNISHADLVLALSLTDNAGNPINANQGGCEPVLARPKFSVFKPTTDLILHWISRSPDAGEAAGPEGVQKDVRSDLVGRAAQGRIGTAMDLWTRLSAAGLQSARFPLLNRNDHDARHPLIRQWTQSVPAGFSLAPGSICPVSAQAIPGSSKSILETFKLRKDIGFSELLDSHRDWKVGISGVYFPLLATIIPRWLQALEESRAQNSWKMVYLVSGVGMPRDESAHPDQNSTEGVSELLEMWLLTHYPGISVRRVHSNTNLFRYDENIAFVKQELLPEIEPIRDALASKLGSEWRENFKLTISFASGSPARITAIQSALRPYRPMFMHMWQLKTLWHESMICLDDIECMSCEDVETLPAVPTEQTDVHVQLVVQRIKQLKRQFDEVVAADRLPDHMKFFGDSNLCKPCGHDMAKFWHRKSRKVVLSVLLVLKEGSSKPQLFSGTNMEVSMPTGSLCAERNAIGSALAADLSLKRSELKIIGVIGLVLPKPQRSRGRSSVQHVPQQPLSLAFSSSPPIPSRSPSGFTLHPATELEQTEQEEEGGGRARQAVLRGLTVDIPDDEEVGAGGLSPPRYKTLRSLDRGDSLASEISLPPTPLTTTGLRNSTSSSALNSSAHPDPSSSPGTPAMLSVKLQVEMEDMNPLKPCGACSEWLKKIAEVNPAFRILTFTDANCTGTYIESVIEA